MSTFEIACEHCASRYAVPYQLREPLRGRVAACSVCAREWIPLPRDARDGAAAGATGGAPVNLQSFLVSNPLAPPIPPRRVDAPTTMRVATVPAVDRPGLRVVASGPGVDHRAVHDLGERAFLIGAEGCHLDLPSVGDLPARAIRVSADGGAFRFEGIGGYAVPIGPISVASGRLEPGKRLDLVLGPYLLELEASATPGQPIRDLEAEPDARTAGYLWQRSVDPDPAEPAPAAAAPPADLSQTVRGLSALGFDTRRGANPFEGVDIGFEGLEAPFAGETFWISKTPSLVGRAAGDVLLADNRVSGKHAQLDVLDVDQYMIKDLASTNGTTVNGRPVSTSRVKDGDEVAFGGVRMRFVARIRRR